MSRTNTNILKALFILAIAAHISVWLHVRDVRGQWLNVPPIPSETGVTTSTLGDKQFAYRLIGIMLQNLGETGGRNTAFKEYNYEDLSSWMMLADKLDPQSHFTPFLAAYYYGASNEADQLEPLVDYLAVVGVRPGGERWRWLAQAIYIARWQMKDLDKALLLARRLAGLSEPDMPAWTRQMPAFILNAKGDKKEAIAIMLEILRSSAEKIHPNEVNFTRDYICNRLMSEAEARDMTLCQNIP